MRSIMLQKWPMLHDVSVSASGTQCSFRSVLCVADDAKPFPREALVLLLSCLTQPASRPLPQLHVANATVTYSHPLHHNLPSPVIHPEHILICCTAGETGQGDVLVVRFDELCVMRADATLAVHMLAKRCGFIASPAACLYMYLFLKCSIAHKTAL